MPRHLSLIESSTVLIIEWPFSLSLDQSNDVMDIHEAVTEQVTPTKR